MVEESFLETILIKKVFLRQSLKLNTLDYL